jgi:mono/diheme cytochrome c family protein
MKNVISVTTSSLLLSMMLFSSCKSGSDKNSIANDSSTVARGQILFNQNCTSCHNFVQDGIGPNLSGLTTKASVDWIRRFIKDPKSMIESGDERAQELFKKYHTVMPSYASYTDKETDTIISYLHAQNNSPKKIAAVDDKALKNPIPDPIPLSDLGVGLEQITQIPHSSEELPFTRITKLGFQPNKSDLYILDLRGKLYKLVNNEPVVYMDMAQLMPKFINQPGLATGFGSFTFHPDFEKNGLFYTTHTESAKSQVADFKYDDTIKVELQWVISEWKTDHPDSVPFSGKSRELFRVNMVSPIHGVQEITFNPLSKPGDEDYGKLYIGIGDGGCVENGFPFVAHHLDKIWGTIIRIDPRGRNSANGQYGIPTSNPYYRDADPKTLREIYAYGFRNPHRITWSKSGKMLASNVGQANIEELNMILPHHDYGWPVREGTFLINPLGDINRVYPLPPDDSIYGLTYPVAQYDHDEGKAITGGFEYLGSAVPELKGKYVFGDMNNGRVFFVNMTDVKLGKQAPIKEIQVFLNGNRVTLRQLCGRDPVDMRFGRDKNGELYVFSKADGKVYKLVKEK